MQDQDQPTTASTKLHLQEYNGHSMTYDDWKYNIQSCIRENNWSVLTAQTHIYLKAAGPIRDKLLNFRDENFASKNAMLAELDKCLLGTETKIKALEMLASDQRKANESAESFFRRLKWAMSNCGLATSDANILAIKRVIRGLNLPFVTPHLLGRSFTTLTGVIDATVDIIEGQSLLNVVPPENVPAQGPINQGSSITPWPSNQQFSRQTEQAPEPMEIGALRSTQRCYNCQRMGHFSYECRYYRSSSARGRGRASQYRNNGRSRSSSSRYRGRGRDSSASRSRSYKKTYGQRIQALHEALDDLTLDDDIIEDEDVSDNQPDDHDSAPEEVDDDYVTENNEQDF